MAKICDEEFYLYFVIRSMVMGVFGAGTFAAVILILKPSNLVYIILISAVNFFLILFVSRLFDSQIKHFVRFILDRLKTHPRIRDFILRNF
jgi:hypothetical protein